MAQQHLERARSSEALPGEVLRGVPDDRFDRLLAMLDRLREQQDTIIDELRGIWAKLP